MVKYPPFLFIFAIMKDRIFEYLKSEDKEIRDLGTSLAKEYLNPEDLKTMDFLSVSCYLDISIAIDQRLFLEERGWKNNES